MKIVDKGEEVKRKYLEDERFKNIEGLIKTHFSSCNVGNLNLSSVEILSLSGEKIASFSAFMYRPGLMELYSKEYEENAINFGKEYEEKGLHKSFKEKTRPTSEEQSFILEKHYF